MRELTWGCLLDTTLEKLVQVATSLNTYPTRRPLAEYDAWENKLYAVRSRPVLGGAAVEAEITPGKPLCLLYGVWDQPLGSCPDWNEYCRVDINTGWRRTLCRSLDYPRFTEEKTASLPDHLAEERPDFSGFVRYEQAISYTEGSVLLEITDAHEGVEVFVNGVSAGIQIVPPFRYDITALLHPGENTLAIEVATTLEREAAAIPGAYPEGYTISRSSRSGITGVVRCYT